MNFYETLGVAHDATDEDIRQAYRRKSAASHPDRGGSTDEMAEINRAYECLSDALRRARYDQSGEEKPEKPVDVEAREALFNIFNDALNSADGNDDIIGFARGQLNSKRAQVTSSLAMGRTSVERATMRARKVRVKTGHNLIQRVLDQRAEQLQKAIELGNRALLVIEAAERILSTDYESDSTLQLGSASGYVINAR